MSFFKELASKEPTLKRRLIIAHIDKTPEEYLKERFVSATVLAVGFGVGIFFLALAFEWNLFGVLAVFLLAWYFLFQVIKRQVDIVIRKRAKEIDKEVLFAGRFLLVKLNAGTPLINAIVEASKSYGVASIYFQEIVRDIELGTPLEQAMEKASRYSPSENFRRIIFQISNALKIGVDVTQFLESTLDGIAEEQLIEIKRYGKKLSGLTMFYMLLAIVVPSLGITLFITVVSFLNITLTLGLFMVILLFLIFVEFLFISIFKSSRPNVNI